MDIANTQPSQMDTSKDTQQSVDGVKVVPHQPIGGAFPGYWIFRSKV